MGKIIKLPEPEGQTDRERGYELRQYTAAQMHNAIVEERERCARICEDAEAHLWEIYKGKSLDDLTGRGRGSDYVQGASDQSGLLAAAIRSQ